MKISFVIPCYRSELTLPTVVNEICGTMQALEYPDYEIILVNDCSPDNTMQSIRSLCAENPRIVGIDLAKNFGQHAALMAGFRHVTGDVVVCMDDDGQTPAGEVGKLLDKLNEGYDIVYASYEEKKHDAFRNWGSRVNSLMTEIMLSKPKELYISSYFAARRYIIDEMTRYNGCYPYVIGLALRSTKNICNVPVRHAAREVGESGYTLKKLLALWMNGFTSFSVKPLRIANYFGMASAILGFVYAIFIVIRFFVYHSAPEGWSSIAVLLLILCGLILMVLGMIGEYIGRIYLCMNSTPQYVIREVYHTEQ